MPKLKIGDKAPLFTLKDQNGENTNLSDYVGKKKIVVYFYPRAMTPGCTTQACGITNNRAKIDKANTIVLGISPDPVTRLRKFTDKHQLNLTLLSDESKEVADLYGVWEKKMFLGKTFLGIKRTTFIIDLSGKISKIIDNVNTKTHHEDILA